MLTQVTTEVLTIFREILDEYHHYLQHAKFNILFDTGSKIKSGKMVYADIGPVSKKQNEIYNLLDFDFNFLLIIYRPEWNRLDDNQKRALIDHELCHCFFDPTSDPPICRSIDHDFTDFFEVIERHGLWNDDLRSNRGSLQMALNLDIPIEKEEAKSIIPQGNINDDEAN